MLNFYLNLIYIFLQALHFSEFFIYCFIYDIDILLSSTYLHYSLKLFFPPNIYLPTYLYLRLESLRIFINRFNI